MAKKQDLTNILAKTEPAAPPADNSDLDEGNIQTTGIGLREGEIKALDTIAGSLELSRNAVMRFAVRWFLLQHRAGKIDLSEFIEQPPPPKKQLRYPGS